MKPIMHFAKMHTIWRFNPVCQASKRYYFLQHSKQFLKGPNGNHALSHSLSFTPSLSLSLSLSLSIYLSLLNPLTITELFSASPELRYLRTKCWISSSRTIWTTAGVNLTKLFITTKQKKLDCFLICPSVKLFLDESA